MIRINNKLEQLFNGKIDVSDIPEDQYRAAFCSRAVASLALMIVCSIDEDSAARAITDAATAKRNDGALVENVRKASYILLFNPSISGLEQCANSKRNR